MSLRLQIRAALEGDIEREIAEGRRRVEAAIQAALRDIGGDLQSGWRSDIESSGLARGPILSRTVRLKFYRNSGLDPAVLVYSNFPIIQRAFERAQTIRARDGRFLLVPNPDVWPGGRIRRARSTSAQGDSLEVARSRFGALTFVPPRNGRAGLVLAEARYSERTGRFSRARKTRTDAYAGGAVTVVVFFVVRQTRSPRLLKGDVIRRRAERAFPFDLQRAFERHLASLERGPLALPRGD